MRRRKKTKIHRMSAELYSLSGTEQHALRYPYQAYQRLAERCTSDTSHEFVPTMSKDKFYARWHNLTEPTRELLCRCFTMTFPELFLILRKQRYSANTQAVLNSQVAEDLFWEIYHYDENASEQPEPAAGSSIDNPPPA